TSTSPAMVVRTGYPSSQSEVRSHESGNHFRAGGRRGRLIESSQPAAHVARASGQVVGTSRLSKDSKSTRNRLAVPVRQKPAAETRSGHEGLTSTLADRLHRVAGRLRR